MFSRFETAGCQVIVVARTTRSNGQLWLERTAFSFPLLLDYDLTLYRQLGLRRDAAKVWSVRSMLYYAHEKIARKPALPSYQGDDLHVLGGDFVFKMDGELWYSYPSKYTDDRPEIESLLDVLKP